jgi:hypothetical protein
VGDGHATMSRFFFLPAEIRIFPSLKDHPTLTSNWLTTFNNPAYGKIPLINGYQWLLMANTDQLLLMVIHGIIADGTIDNSSISQARQLKTCYNPSY